MDRIAERGWAAGLFEGEGCLMIGGRGDNPKLSLISTDRDVLDRFHAFVGVGTIHKRPAPIKETHRQQWGWQTAAAQDVRHVIELLAPHFGQRRAAKADEVLACCKRVEARKIVTECPAGHLYDETNTYVSPQGYRFCRACNKVAGEKYRAKKRAVA